MNKVLAKPLALTAGILGLVQGIVWTICPFLCILSYFGSLQVDLRGSNVDQTDYYKLIYSIFLDDDDNDISKSLPDNRVVKAREFFIFMWFYLGFSVLLALVSGAIVWSMIRDKWHLTKGLFGSWAAITFLTSIVDIVLMALLVVDYINVNNDSFSTSIVVCYGILMTVAARGYLLWVINVIFAVVMTKYALDIILKDKNNTPTLPIIHGFESNGVTPAWFDDSVKSFWASPQSPASEGIDNHGFERSQSFFSPLDENAYAQPLGQTTNGQLPNQTPFPQQTFAHVHTPSQRPTSEPPSNISPFAQAIANRTATIGRNKGRRSPLNNVPPPFIPDPDYDPPDIPDPDYTPPSTPTGLKSVLRSKSNYNNYVEPY